MKYDALIFDLDGTLWDAAPASTRGWNTALAEMGVSSRVTVDGIRSVSGNPFARCVEILLPELLPVSEAMLRSLDAHERAGIAALGGVLYEGVADGLPDLAAVYPLFLVSNCPGWYIDAFFNATGLRDCFTGWDSHGASGLGKTGMLLAMRDLHDLAQPVYVGDIQGDKDAADEAGMDFALVRYGFGDVKAPSLSFGSFEELIKRFLG